MLPTHGSGVRLCDGLTLLFVVLAATPCQAEAPKLFREKSFTCVTLAEAVNHYVSLGEEATVKELESLVSDGFPNGRIGCVCRILFIPKEKEPLRAPLFGSLSLPWKSM